MASPTPKGYIIKNLLHKHWKLVSDKIWVDEDGPVQGKAEYIEDMIWRFGSLAAYTIEKPSEPVAWTLRLKGDTTLFTIGVASIGGGRYGYSRTTFQEKNCMQAKLHGCPKVAKTVHVASYTFPSTNLTCGCS